MALDEIYRLVIIKVLFACASLQVGAVRASPTDRTEAAWERHLLRSSTGRHGRNWPDEDIFVAQLARRARLLDRIFQQRVVEILQQHAVDDPTHVSNASDQESSSIDSVVASFKCMFVQASEVQRSEKAAESIATVCVHAGPIKSIQRIRAKLSE